MGHHHRLRPTPLADPTRQHRPATTTRAVVSPADHATRRHRSLTCAAPQPDSPHPARPGPHLLFENSIENYPTRWSRCRVPVARNPFGTRGLEARRWRSSAPRPPGWGTARDSSIAGRGASRVRRASRPTARVLDSYPAARTPACANGEAVQTSPRANPDNSCGVAESNPTTSSIPASLGSAIVKPVDVMPTTTSFAFGFTSRRYCASAWCG